LINLGPQALEKAANAGGFSFIRHGTKLSRGGSRPRRGAMMQA
jgi:hypothetical protein